MTQSQNGMFGKSHPNLGERRNISISFTLESMRQCPFPTREAVFTYLLALFIYFKFDL